MPGDWRKPYDIAEREYQEQEGLREVPEELMDCYICEKLGISQGELDEMRVETVWRWLGWHYGRELAMAAGRKEGPLS